MLFSLNDNRINSNQTNSICITQNHKLHISPLGEGKIHLMEAQTGSVMRDVVTWLASVLQWEQSAG